MTEKITDKLANKLKEEKDLQNFLTENQQDLKEANLKEFLQNLLETKQLNKTEVIKNSGLDKTYAYKIFSGEKKNPYTYDYELELYKTVLKCCGISFD